MCQIALFLQFLVTLFPILINSFTESLRFLRSLTTRRAVLAAENRSSDTQKFRRRHKEWRPVVRNPLQDNETTVCNTIVAACPVN
jgi:hypothetical protein